MIAMQLDLFEAEFAAESEPQPIKKKKITRRSLKAGEIAYFCSDCDEKEMIYKKVIPKLKCEKCGLLMECREYEK